MIDTASLLSSVDLPALIERDTGHAGRKSGRWVLFPCPFHDDSTPSLAVTPDNGRWHCFGCGKGGDALAYVAAREGLNLKHGPDFHRACDLLGAVDTLPRRARPPAPVEKESGPPSAEWQVKARHVIEETVTALWRDTGTRAREWLHARGLADETLRRWRIGYCEGSGYRDIAGLPVPCGIVIPCEVGGVIWYLKVRRATGEPKYIHVKGGRPALFGADSLRGQSVAVICEGEFDAILLHQHAGDLCGVATVGSATGTLDLAHFGQYLLPVKRLLLAYDLDGPGRKGAAKLAALTRRARRVTLPALAGVKDLTDFHKAGGNLRDWLAFELARLDRNYCSAMTIAVNSTGTAIADRVTASASAPAHVTALPANDVTSPAHVTALPGVVTAWPDSVSSNPETPFSATDACIAVTPSAGMPSPDAVTHPGNVIAGNDVTSPTPNEVTEPTGIPPAWAGQTVNVADVPEVCRRYGVTVCGADVPRGVMMFTVVTSFDECHGMTPTRATSFRPDAVMAPAAGMPLPPDDDPDRWAAIFTEESAALALAEGG